MRSSAVKVGARTYAIASLSEDDFDLLLAQKGVCDDEIKSFIDYDEQLIVVRDKLLTDHKRELVIHELLHAALADAGVVQDENSERFIASLAPRLNVLFNDGLKTVLAETT